MTETAPSLPATMTAIEITEFGDPDVLKPATRDVPQPGEGEILLEVAAAGVNRPDCLQRKGGYPPPPGASDIPGLEIAGTVVAIGDGVDQWKIGDQACALVTGGGYAQYAVAHATHCLPVPVGLENEQAAALPETFFTVWHNVFQRGGLKSGQSLLVHGGSSGIGTTAIQLAKAFGATVFTTAGSTEKCDACRKLGADFAINYREEDFVKEIRRETAGQGVDVILDMVGGDYIARNLEIAALDGRIVQIAFLQGPKVEINLLPVMLKRLSFTGSTLRGRDVAFKAALAAQLEAEVWPLLAKGDIAPLIHRAFPLEEAAEAHALMESSEHIGKIVLTNG